MVFDPLGRVMREYSEEEEEVDVESGGGSLLPSSLTKKEEDEKKVLGSQLQCIKIYVLEPLLRHPKSPPFRKPVDAVALGIPDYPKIITRPMDLGSVRDKIRTRKYSSYLDCVHDIDLIWKNAKKFNPPDHFVHKTALELEEFSKERVSKIDFRTCRYTDLPSNKRRKVSSSSGGGVGVGVGVVGPHNNNNNNNNNSNSGGIGGNNHGHMNNLRHIHQSSNNNHYVNPRKPPLDACREILEELINSDVHSFYADPFKRHPNGRLDLIKIRNRLKKNIYVHPLQVAEDLRSIITRTYRSSADELSPLNLCASQLQHKFEVMFAKRVAWDIQPKPDLSDHSIFTQNLLLAQNSLLSIQSSFQNLVTSFYVARGRKKRTPKKKSKNSINQPRKRSPPSAPVSPVKKKRKVEPVPEPKWSRDLIIDLQNRIGQLDEHHQQPILSLMHKNGEKITEDEEGYVVLDIEEASSKSLNDIKNYIDSLSATSSVPLEPPVHEKPPVAVVEPLNLLKNSNQKHSANEDDSGDESGDSSSESSDSSSDDTSDEED